MKFLSEWNELVKVSEWSWVWGSEGKWLRQTRKWMIQLVSGASKGSNKRNMFGKPFSRLALACAPPPRLCLFLCNEWDVWIVCWWVGMWVCMYIDYETKGYRYEGVFMVCVRCVKACLSVLKKKTEHLYIYLYYILYIYIYISHKPSAAAPAKRATFSSRSSVCGVCVGVWECGCVWVL